MSRKKMRRRRAEKEREKKALTTIGAVFGAAILIALLVRLIF